MANGNHKHAAITLICCEDDVPTEDMRLLADTLAAQGVPVHLLAGRMRRSLKGGLQFLGKLVEQRRAIAGSYAVVLDAYCFAVSMFPTGARTKVVQIWHASEAIKKFSLQIVGTPAGQKPRLAKWLKMHKGYDYILCPADATLPFFEAAFGYPASAFVKLGLPVLDRIAAIRAEKNIAAAVATPCRDRILARYPKLGGKRIVVYAPTFRDGRPVDAQGVAEAFGGASAAGDFALVLKLHPLDMVYADSARALAGAGGILLDRAFALHEWFALADAIITDYSGVAVEAAAAGIASYYYCYDAEEYGRERGLNVDLSTEAIGKYVFADARTLAWQLLYDLQSGTYDYGALAAFRAKYLEVPLTGNTGRLAAFLQSLR
ncbi:MAG: CDP-glycerol glycerophosphotransferase family protein [Clostridiales Family XIII bacterium]|jgi:CDP-ribitol ribitolphosphotransferase|nr:CDP-glycerol glycerophosphotransferase family protein [Clostridiales Family XIII bacterium]